MERNVLLIVHKEEVSSDSPLIKKHRFFDVRDESTVDGAHHITRKCFTSPKEIRRNVKIISIGYNSKSYVKFPSITPENHIETILNKLH